MSVTEFQRHQVFTWFEESMGSERAAIMMDLLPPVGWGDIATGTDLAMLRAEMSVLRSDVMGEVAVLRSEVMGEITGLRGEIASANASLLHKIVFAFVVSNTTLVTLVLAVVQNF